MEIQEIVEGIVTKVDELTKSMAVLLTLGAEVKSLDGSVQDIKAELAVITAADFPAIERKSLDALSGLGERLDGIERTINESAVHSDAKRKEEQQKSFDAFDLAVRNKEDVELKSLDSDLKQQDVFFDDLLQGMYPLLGLVFSRPTNSDSPRYSYPVAGIVNIKGEAAGASGSRKKVTLTVDTFEYQPTVDRGDVEDVGAQMFLDEQAAHAEGTMETLNANVVDAIEAAGVAKASITDEYTEVAIIETDAIGVVDDDDLNETVGELPLKYRRGAVWLGNATMVATLKGVVDGAGTSMWAPSLSEGTPPLLKGYPFIEDENVADDRLIFGNPKRGSAVIEREKSVLSNIERSGGDYKPYYAARYARGNTDARAWKIQDTKS